MGEAGRSESLGASRNAKGKLVLTPKTLVDKQVEQGLGESFEDFRQGRSHGPFASAKEAIRFLHQEAKKRKKAQTNAS